MADHGNAPSQSGSLPSVWLGERETPSQFGSLPSVGVGERETPSLRSQSWQSAASSPVRVGAGDTPSPITRFELLCPELELEDEVDWTYMIPLKKTGEEPGHSNTAKQPGISFSPPAPDGKQRSMKECDSIVSAHVCGYLIWT